MSDFKSSPPSPGNGATHASRPQPMKVICAGMARTGTTSLAAALKILGYHPYDGPEVLRLGHAPAWTQAMEAKFLGKGTRWGRTEFDSLLADFDCTLDVPCNLFVSDLLAAYPDAKVVLTQRAAHKWWSSISQTIFRVYQWRTWKYLSYIDPGFRTYFKFTTLIWHVFCGVDFSEENCRAKYLEHNQRVAGVVPQEDLLRFDVAEGWEPLCAFLGKERPEEEFPHVNDSQAFVKRWEGQWGKVCAKGLKRVGLGLALVVAGSSVGFAYLRRS